MELQTRKEKNGLVITINGRMDAVTAPKFEESLTELITQGEKRFLLDFSGLEYISSAGLRSLLVLAKKLKPLEGELLLAGIQGPVDEVFKISGFYSIFKIADSLEAALLQF